MMRDTVFTVDYNKVVTKGVHEIRLISERRLPVLHCGQFLHLEVPGLASVLRRPFCLYRFDAQSVTIVVAVVGRGTELLCRARPGDTMRAVLPLGNGFVLAPEHKRIAAHRRRGGVRAACRGGTVLSGQDVPRLSRLFR